MEFFDLMNMEYLNHLVLKKISTFIVDFYLKWSELMGDYCWEKFSEFGIWLTSWVNIDFDYWLAVGEFKFSNLKL
jgi:hypothetical protein